MRLPFQVGKDTGGEMKEGYSGEDLGRFGTVLAEDGLSRRDFLRVGGAGLLGLTLLGSAACGGGSGGNAFWSLVMSNLWRTWPFAFLLLLAALQNIPSELYDAASVDGASRWKQFRSITLPLLRPVSAVIVLVLFLWTFNDFNTPYILFGQSPPESSGNRPQNRRPCCRCSSTSTRS